MTVLSPESEPGEDDAPLMLAREVDPEPPSQTAAGGAAPRSSPTLAPRAVVRERTRETFDEPLFPPRPKPPAWKGAVAIGAGIAVGLTLTLALVALAGWLLGGGEPAATPTPTPLVPYDQQPATAAPTVEAGTSIPVATAGPTGPSPRATAPIPAPSRRAPTPEPAASPAPWELEDTPRPGSAASPVVPTGMLRVTAKPACKVFVDRGKTAETTPFERSLSSGKHVLGFVHEASGLWIEETHAIPDGGTLELFVDVEQATVHVRE
jgi:hypothetical protein